MNLRGLWVIALFINILYGLLAAYFFLAAAFFGSSTFLKLLKELPLLYTLPILFSLITFVLTLYQSYLDSKQGLEIASTRTHIYFILNFIFIIFSSYRIMRG